MLRLPISEERNAAQAALHHEVRDANKSTGSGANHISGHQGTRPLPNHISTAVETTARNPMPMRL
jgi:hypothetical protein